MSSELRQRKNAAGSGATNSGSSTFSQRAQADQRQRQVDAAAEAELKKKRPSVVGRFLLFIGLPSFMGFLGMVTSYGRNVAEGKKDISLINFDQDFFFPFMLMLVIIVVVGFQTNGFTKNEPKPFIAWPKVTRKRKVIHRKVFVDDDGEGVAADEGSRKED